MRGSQRDLAVEVLGNPMGKRKKIGKTMEKTLGTLGQKNGKYENIWENDEKTWMVNLWESLGKAVGNMRNIWENYGKNMGNTMGKYANNVEKLL